MEIVKQRKEKTEHNFKKYQYTFYQRRRPSGGASRCSQKLKQNQGHIRESAARTAAKRCETKGSAAKRCEKNSATGRYNPKKRIWEWDKVTWKFDPSKNIYYSNREYPNHFWNASNWRKSVKKKEQRNGAAGIILLRRQNKGFEIFVVQCYKNKYGFPKGKRNYEETFFSAALREFKEETGTHLSFDQQLFERIEINSRYKDDDIPNKYITKKIVFYVLVVPEQYEIRTKPEADVEITSFGWVSLKKLPFIFRLSKVAQSVYPRIEEYVNNL